MSYVPTFLATNEAQLEQRREAAATNETANVEQMLASCAGDADALAQLIGQLPPREREAILAAAHQRFGNAFVAQALQRAEKGGDDDVIKVDSSATRTPAQRAADLLARLTALDAKIARSEVARLPKFRPKLEAEYKQFCLAYGCEDSKASRLRFVQYLESAHLGAKPKAVTADQQASGALNVLFDETAPGTSVALTAVGVREALDPRTELTAEQREKLKTILLEDGRTALQARLEAEQLWQQKKINVVIDVNAAYASGNPHLAAFTSAATDAGYTSQEIEMVARGKNAKWLWSPLSSDRAMPSTLEEYKGQGFGKGPQERYLLDVTRLEDARAAIARGMTLEELDAARQQAGYDPSFRSKMTNESVTTVVDAYIPMEMRPVVGPLLTRLCSPDQAQRDAAARELQALVGDAKRFGPGNAKALRAAIDGLQAQFGMKDDPMLQLLRVQLDMEANPPGALQIADLTQRPVDPLNPTADTRTENQKQSAEMRAKAERQIEQVREQLRARQEAGSLPREEAARLYEMMAALYRGYVGDGEKAEECLVMARMYRSDAAEREDATRRLEAKAPLQREVLISRRDPSEPTSVRATSEDERELGEMEEEDEERDKEMLAEAEAEMNRKSAEFPPGQPSWAQPQKAETERGRENQERVEGANSFLYLVKLALEWYAADRKMNAIADRRERKQQLEEKIKRETTVRVPPDPAKLRETIQWLVANEQPRLAAKMRLVLDAALAFYDRR